jgi:hypothetical protein
LRETQPIRCTSKMEFLGGDDEVPELP